MKRLVVLLCLLFATGVAEARTVPLTNPKPNDSTDSIGCWKWFPVGGSNTTIGLQRTCSGTYVVDFPLPVDDPGTYSVVVTGARQSTSSTVQCQTFTVTNTGVYTAGRPISLTSSSTVFLPLNLDPVVVADGGTLWLRCLVSQNARLLQVDYNWTGF